MKKNILLFMPNIEKGGIEKNLILLSSYLIKNSNITIVCGEITAEVKEKLDNKIKIIIAKNYVAYTIFTKRILNTINCFFEILKNKKKIILDNTIIFSLQNHPFPIFLSKLIKKKIIIRIANHPYSSLRYFNNLPIFYFKIFIKLFFYRFANGIICNSNSSRLYLKKFLKNKSVTTIFNPLIIGKESNSNNLRKNILTVGRLENQKNISGIIKALGEVKKIHPNLKLIIIGSGSEKNKLNSLIDEMNLNKNIEFKGYIDPENFLLNSKILILNSFFEGMPNILLEGLACKIPIISTNCKSGPNEILDNGKYGKLIEVDNHKNLSEAILDTLKNYEKAQKMADKGYNSLNRFEKNQQLNKIESYLEKFF